MHFFAFLCSVRTTLNLDADLARALREACRVTGEKEATVTRLALRLGLPLLLRRHQAGDFRDLRGAWQFPGGYAEALRALRG